MTEFSTDNQPERRGDQAEAGKGNTKRKVLTEALMLALNRDDMVGDDGKPTRRLASIANQLTKKAAEGDIQAIKECFDRTEGKAAQAIIHQGDEDNPIKLHNQFVFIPVGADDKSDKN